MGGRFFPERYQTGQGETMENTIDQYLAPLPSSGKTIKTIRDEQLYGKWRKIRLKGKQLHHITPALLDEAKQRLVTHEYGQTNGDGKRKRYSAQTIVHDMKFMRHVLNLAVRDGKLDRNPFIRVKLTKVSRDRGRGGPFWETQDGTG
ncbi:hypothetical protein [Candidatus Nitronereus thalassa]|uniref:Phage integrase SAM-like domain-containing protein n=1 Tax=Candidatus Nitronereus thalassa TaxID=3020898 RepID=A0ABU3K327_9BACT|nr:hypothetical protein [Candidatus Nitronereus thalassa]MDT7040800.1 hypothetical protein [Candidatus Nitronereus thalassa]